MDNHESNGAAAAAELDGFTLFSTSGEPDPNGDDLLGISSERLGDDDPMDVLFAPPVQDFLMREDTPDKTTSSSTAVLDLPKGRSLFGSAGRDFSGFSNLSLPESVEMPPDLLSDCEEQSVKQDCFPEAVRSDEILGDEAKSTLDEDYYPIPSRRRGRSLGVTPSPAPMSSFSFRSAQLSGDVPPVAPSAPFAAAVTSASTVTPQPKVARSTRGLQRKQEIASEGSFTEPKKKLRRTQSTSIMPTPDRQVKIVRSKDVLFGKGGKINKHQGNLRYHNEKKELQKEYLNQATTKPRKRELVQQLYDVVIHDWGGRFLRRGDEGGEAWYEAHKEAALEKCRQALATPERSKEQRAARRRMFLEKRRGKKS